MNRRRAASLAYIPALYALGWLLARPIGLLLPALAPATLALIGTVISFGLMLLSLPWWLARQWHSDTPWRDLGLAAPPGLLLACWLRGLARAASLLLALALVLLLGGWARWQGVPDAATLANGLALTVGVGLAEEVVFRGWLWLELAHHLGDPELRGRPALLLQAVVFALAHTRFDLEPLALLSLLGALLLLGVLLALIRRGDGGVLSGAIGFHGGLVGGWFLLGSGLLALPLDGPALLLGASGGAANPIAGLPGWLGLLGWLLLLRRFW